MYEYYWKLVYMPQYVDMRTIQVPLIVACPTDMHLALHVTNLILAAVIPILFSISIVFQVTSVTGSASLH
jgi:hypothetical protein